jgi:hypothetical protein
VGVVVGVREMVNVGVMISVRVMVGVYIAVGGWLAVLTTRVHVPLLGNRMVRITAQEPENIGLLKYARHDLFSFSICFPCCHEVTLHPAFGLSRIVVIYQKRFVNFHGKLSDQHYLNFSYR